MDRTKVLPKAWMALADCGYPVTNTDTARHHYISLCT